MFTTALAACDLIGRSFWRLAITATPTRKHESVIERMITVG